MKNRVYDLKSRSGDSRKGRNEHKGRNLMKATALTNGVTRFLSNPLRIFLAWRSLRPLREIPLLFLG